MSLTNKEKARLATELCGARLRPLVKGWGSHRAEDEALGWEFPNSVRVEEEGFDPENNWNHMRLVLEGLVKREKMIIFKAGIHDDGRMWGECYSLNPERRTSIANSFASAVCAAGLEILREVGKK